MTPVIKTVGKTIRELIESERTPTTIPKLDPTLIKKILKKEEEKIIKYKDIHGVEFYVGSKYYNYRVDDIIVCTYSKFGKNGKLIFNAVVGSNFPIYQDKIIKSDGNLTALNWNKFRNKYKFELVNEETPMISDKVMQELIGNSDSEKMEIRKINRWLKATYYKGVILETVMHVKTEKDMTVIEDQENLEKELQNNQYWKRYKDENLGIIYGNDSLSIAIWKYNTVWIITSNSSLLNIRTYLKKK